jgi:capsule polysaccharide export protein KpsE/RkpR
LDKRSQTIVSEVYHHSEQEEGTHRGSPDSQLIVVDSGEQMIESLRLLWNRRRFLLRSTAFGFFAILAITLLIPTQYQSTTLLMPPDQTRPSGMSMLPVLGGSRDGLGLGIAGSLLGKSSGELFVGILRSRSVADDLINRFDLRSVYWVKHYDDARKKLASRTDISEDSKSGIISIAVSDRDRQRAAVMAQFYVDDLNRLVAQLSTSSAHRERVFLEQRLQTVKTDLNSAAVEFSQFASRNSAIDVPEQGKAMVESVARLQGEMIAAQSELSGLEEIYSQSNVRVRALQARIDELQRQLEKVGGKDIGVQSGGAEDAGSLYPSIRELPLLGVKYADLYRKVKIEEAVFEALTKQYEMAKVEEAKEIPTVRVLDPAAVPEHKSFPPRLAIAGVGAMLTSLAAIIWVLVGAYWSRLDAIDPVRRLVHDIFLDVKMYRAQATARLIKLHMGNDQVANHVGSNESTRMKS